MTYKISWWKTSFGEKEIKELRKAVFNEHISQGPVTEKFEKEIGNKLEIPYSLVTTSGSAALFLALKALNIGPNDEVIVPNRTWIATAHAVLLAGAKVVLVDVRSDIPVMDITHLKSQITPHTKAIIVVHLNGRSVEMQKIQKIAKEHHLAVIEDACQAFLSQNNNGYLGTQSDIGCFSLGVTKLISTGQGGFVVTKNKALYEKMTSLRNHGVKDIFTDTWNQFGFNFKFTDLLASFGLVQLKRSSRRLKHLKKVYTIYEKGLKDISFLKLVPIDIARGEIPLYIEVLCNERGKLISFLKSKKIQVRPVPPNLNISAYIHSKNDFKNSKIFSENGLYLPSGPEQPLKNINSVLDVLKTYK